MKVWVKHLISTVVFGVIYTLLEYLFSKDIDWKMVIISTIIYGVLNIVFRIADKKAAAKK